MKLVDFDTAKTLQELGYDGYYNYIYAKNTESSLRYIGFKEVFEISEYTGPPAPRLDDAAYWLREKHGICISVTPSLFGDNANSFAYRIDQWNEAIGAIDAWVADIYSVELPYNDAYEAAVTKAIEIIKNRQQ